MSKPKNPREKTDRVLNEIIAALPQGTRGPMCSDFARDIGYSPSVVWRWLFARENIPNAEFVLAAQEWLRNKRAQNLPTSGELKK